MESLNLPTHQNSDKVNPPRHANSPNTYRYRPLRRKNQEIRLLKLLPGIFDDEIKLNIFHVPLIEPERAPDTRLSLAELQSTLSVPWQIYKTVEGRYVFRNDFNGSTQWDHPNPDFYRELYDSPTVLDPFPNFEPAYEALSYTWGEEEATAHISVLPSKPADRSGTLIVRPNLNMALKHLRRQDTDRVLWIDALCIDQEDETERSQQVKRMGKIFSLAHRVVVWLGAATPDDSSERALNILAAFGKAIEYCTSQHLIKSPVVDHASATSSLLIEDFECSSLSHSDVLDVLNTEEPLRYDKEDYVAIENLLERSWWDRLWIWQEICLASCRSIVKCGKHSIPWYFVRRAIIFLTWRTELHVQHVLNERLMQQRAGICRTKVDPTAAPLVLMRLTRAARYSNQHDRIYALFGILSPDFVSLLKADYSLPLAHLFKDVCMALLSDNENLNFLEFCDIDDQELENGKPSWVPNWLKSGPPEPLLNLYVSGLGGCGPIQLRNGSELSVYGVVCGTVEGVADLAPLEGDLQPVLRLWEQFVKSHRGDTCAEWKEGFVKTLQCGNILENFLGLPLPSLEECLGSYDNHEATSIVSSKLRGRALFMTLEGSFGVCSPATKAGDMLAVILGCGFPVFLRPSTALETPDMVAYQVVGPAYVEHIKNSEPLLGSLPSGSERHLDWDMNGLKVLGFTDVKSGNVVYDDPRLGPLPGDWEFAKKYEPRSVEQRMYKNKTTGEVTWRDPRTTSEELRKRGTPIQEIVLV